jgi:hypothetical protein
VLSYKSVLKSQIQSNCFDFPSNFIKISEGYFHLPTQLHALQLYEGDSGRTLDKLCLFIGGTNLGAKQEVRHCRNPLSMWEEMAPWRSEVMEAERLVLIRTGAPIAYS